jgi:hypothetical protein
VTREITAVRIETDGERAEAPHAPRQPDRLVPIPEAARVEVRGPIAVAERRRPAEEPAVVEITIGGVEVHAVPPPPAPPARTPPPAAPSLDEYLERRHGAKR